MTEELNRHPVLARWAYSELTSIDHGRKYERPGIAELRAKFRERLPFDDLDQKECDLLLAGWEAVRGGASIFNHLIAGISTFEAHEWSKDEIAQVFGIPSFVRDVVSDSLVHGLRLNFQIWIEAAPVRPLHQGHARYAAIGSAPVWRQVDPITVGRYPHTKELILLDGYHRAVRFWAQSDPDIKLTAYVPK